MLTKDPVLQHAYGFAAILYGRLMSNARGMGLPAICNELEYFATMFCLKVGHATCRKATPHWPALSTYALQQY